MPFGTLTQIIFWVVRGRWGIILGGWGWVRKYFGWVGVCALFDNNQFYLNNFLTFTALTLLVTQ